MDKTIDYKQLTSSDLHPELLSDFVRFQETHKVWYRTEVGYSIKNDHFIDYWDDEKKQQVVEDLRRCFQGGGAVFGAWVDGNLIGFANIEGHLFGGKSQYVELPYIHVSAELRGSGIGRNLLRLCKEAAKLIGADKLYIAAHPSIETQDFYKKMGCTYALELNEEILKKEPLDIQMELSLGKGESVLVTLRFVIEDDRFQLDRYDLTEEQLRFTATPIDSIRMVEIEPNRYPVVILYGEIIAGYFALHTDEGPEPYSENRHAILLRSYSIRNSCQGRGIAQQSMRLLPAFVKEHFPDVNEMVLTVNYQNTAAQHIYQKAGFTDTGKRVTGRSGEQYIYSLAL